MSVQTNDQPVIRKDPGARKIWRENRDLDQFPGDMGLPVFGHTLSFLKDSLGFAQSRYKKYGPVWRFHTLFQDGVSLLGPDASELILMDRGKVFSNHLGWAPTLDDLFRNGLMLRDFDDHKIHRAVMQTAFKKPAMQGYLDALNDGIARRMDDWAKRPKMKFYNEVKQLTLDLAAEIFLGAEMGEETKKINKAFVDTVAASIAVVRYNVPGLSYARGLAGRKYLENLFADMIPRRRAGNGRDMLTWLAQAETPDGERYSDQEIVDHMIFLMMAAHDTTTSALSTMVWALCQHPDWQEKLRAEMQAYDKPNLDFADLHDFPLTEWTFKEALRLYSPLGGMLRRSIKPCEFGGYTIPENTLVTVTANFTHHMDTLWDAPNAFDPMRFSPERAEDKRHKFAFLPFGGGAHKCIGMHFADMQVKAVMLHFLRRFRVTLKAGHTPSFALVPIVKPKGGLPVELHELR